MITHDARRSLSHGNNPVPSPWLATVLARSDLLASLCRRILVHARCTELAARDVRYPPSTTRIKDPYQFRDHAFEHDMTGASPGSETTVMCCQALAMFRRI